MESLKDSRFNSSHQQTEHHGCYRYTLSKMNPERIGIQHASHCFTAAILVQFWFDHGLFSPMLQPVLVPMGPRSRPSTAMCGRPPAGPLTGRPLTGAQRDKSLAVVFLLLACISLILERRGRDGGFALSFLVSNQHRAPKEAREATACSLGSFSCSQSMMTPSRRAPRSSPQSHS